MVQRRIRHAIRRVTLGAGVAVIVGALGAAPLAASAAPANPAAGRALPASTRFYVPPPAQGSFQQELQLLFSSQFKAAGLIAEMEATPQAVWLTGETAAQAAEGALGSQQADFQVRQQVSQTVFAAALQRAVPVLVAYNIPGRDCSQYSAGGAPSDAAYDQWINALAQGLGNGKAVVILEPDALANLPTDCSAAYQAANPLITDATREADVADGVTTLEADPNASVYIDGGHSAWQSVGTIAATLVAAGVQSAQGFFLNVSNYQYAANNVYFGTWVSDCIAMGAGSLTYDYATTAPTSTGTADPREQIATLLGAWTGVALSPYGVWSDARPRPSTGGDRHPLRRRRRRGRHFVIDTSRDGLGPNDMEAYYAAPYDQPQSVVGSTPGVTSPTTHLRAEASRTATGATCRDRAPASCPRPAPASSRPCSTPIRGSRPPASPTASAILPAASGTGATPRTRRPSPDGRPAPAPAFQTFDRSGVSQTGTVLTDPAAGASFPQQALQLAENANPALTFPLP